MGELSLRFDEDLTTTLVRDLRERCNSASEDNSTINLNFSGVKNIGNDGILLLIQLREYAKSRQIAITLDEVSPEISNALFLLGLHDALQIRSKP